MQTVFVQFSDEKEDTIISAFSCRQDSASWSNQGEVSVDDPRWKAYYDLIPAGPMRQAWPAPIF